MLSMACDGESQSVFVSCIHPDLRIKLECDVAF